MYHREFCRNGHLVNPIIGYDGFDDPLSCPHCGCEEFVKISSEEALVPMNPCGRERVYIEQSSFTGYKDVNRYDVSKVPVERWNGEPRLPLACKHCGGHRDCSTCYLLSSEQIAAYGKPFLNAQVA